MHFNTFGKAFQTSWVNRGITSGQRKSSEVIRMQILRLRPLLTGWDKLEIKRSLHPGDARIEANNLPWPLQKGENIGLPHSHPMPDSQRASLPFSPTIFATRRGDRRYLTANLQCGVEQIVRVPGLPPWARAHRSHRVG